MGIPLFQSSEFPDGMPTETTKGFLPRALMALTISIDWPCSGPEMPVPAMPSSKISESRIISFPSSPFHTITGTFIFSRDIRISAQGLFSDLSDHRLTTTTQDGTSVIPVSIKWRSITRASAPLLPVPEKTDIPG